MSLLKKLVRDLAPYDYVHEWTIKSPAAINEVRLALAKSLAVQEFWKHLGMSKEEIDKTFIERRARELLNTTDWVGCGECDVSFPCYNGKTSCIRLPVEDNL